VSFYLGGTSVLIINMWCANGFHVTSSISYDVLPIFILT